MQYPTPSPVSGWDSVPTPWQTQPQAHACGCASGGCSPPPILHRSTLQIVTLVIEAGANVSYAIGGACPADAVITGLTFVTGGDVFASANQYVRAALRWTSTPSADATGWNAGIRLLTPWDTEEDLTIQAGVLLPPLEIPIPTAGLRPILRVTDTHGNTASASACIVYRVPRAWHD